MDQLIFTDATIKTVILNGEEYDIQRILFKNNRLNTNSIRLKKNNKPKYILHRRNVSLFTTDKSFKRLLLEQDVNTKNVPNNLFWRIPSYISCIAENKQNYLILTEILEEKVDLPLFDRMNLLLRVMDGLSLSKHYLINLSYDTLKFYKHNDDIRPLLTKNMIKKHARKVEYVENFSIPNTNITSFSIYLFKLSNVFYMMALKHYEVKNSAITDRTFEEYYRKQDIRYYKNTDLQVVRVILAMRLSNRLKITRFEQLRLMLLKKIVPEQENYHRKYCTVDTEEQ